jgi:hypothetical protein
LTQGQETAANSQEQQAKQAGKTSFHIPSESELILGQQSGPGAVLSAVESHFAWRG